MFKNEYQGGSYFEVFSPQQKDALSHWKVTGAIKKNYDREVKSFSYMLEGSPATTKMQLPKDSRHALHLVQRYLILQLHLRKGCDFNMELGFSDMKNSKRRLLLSTAQKEIHVTPLHAKVPMRIVKTGMWINLCLDMVSMVDGIWRGETFQLLDSISISANCRLRKIFTMKVQPPDTVGDDELYGCAPSNSGELECIPKQCQFASEVNSMTQLLTIDKVKHAERLRGDVRGSVNSVLDLDLNASGRKSSTGGGGGCGDAFHIAFGSKIAGVRTSQSAGKKSARDGNGNLTNRSMRSSSRVEADGVSTSGYQDMSVSVNSRDSMYTGRDPGGGSRDAAGGGAMREGEGSMPVHIPNPPERARPAGMRKGHQRQYSDPVSIVDTEPGANYLHEGVPMVTPHPPREPSHEGTRRRRPRVKNGSAGKDRVVNSGAHKDDVSGGTGHSSAALHTQGHAQRHRVVSDGDVLNTSNSSTESGPKPRSAENARRPPVEIRLSKPQRKEYRPCNYQPDGAEMDESVSDVIDILRHKVNLYQDEDDDDESSDEDEEELDLAINGAHYLESDGEMNQGLGMYMFSSHPKPAPRQKNASPSQQYIEAAESGKYQDAQQRGNRLKIKENSKSRGPKPEEDFINTDDSSDEEDRLRALTARQGSRPNSGSRPSSGSRPNSGTRPNSGNRPNSGTRPSHLKTNNSGRPQVKGHGSSPKRHLPNLPTSDSGYGSNSAISSDKQSHATSNGIPIPSLRGLTNGMADSLVPHALGSPTFTTQITDRSCVSRVSRKSLREIPPTDSRFIQSIEEKPYDFSQYVVEDLSASAEARMLAEIQGARSEEFEPENLMDAPAEPHKLIKTPPMIALPDHHQKGDRMVGLDREEREDNDDSPTVTSDDDTSFSTWKAPPPRTHMSNYQREMGARLSSDTLTLSNQQISGVCSPPVLRGGLGSNSLDDVSTLSNISPRKLMQGGSPMGTDDEEDELDLLYDQQLNCYYDPKTCTYYELS